MFKWLADLFFPDFCLHCHRGRDVICIQCLAQAEKLAYWLVKERSSFLLPYQINSEAFWPARALHLLKYEGFRRFAPVLNRLLIPHLPDLPVVYVPISSGKRKKRGFNQLELILMAGGRVRICSILRKKRENVAQMSLAAGERKANVFGAYEVILGTLIPEKLVLFDDMKTTGSTLAEIAGLLHSQGAKEIQGMTLLGKIESWRLRSVPVWSSLEFLVKSDKIMRN